MASLRPAAAALSTIALLVAPALFAEPTPADRALATELFNQGRDELARGDLGSACPKLEESQRLDPGGGTLLNVARCHEQQGRTASAWTEYNEALAIAEREGQNERASFASERIAALEPRLSKLVVLVPADSDRVDLVILRDGTPVARLAWRTAMPIDPGHHVIVASAPGFRAWSTEIEVGPERDRDELTIPPLEPLPPPVKIEPVLTPPPPVLPPPPIVLPRTESGTPPARIAGWVVASVGFATLGAATAAGIATIVKDGESDELCEPVRCDDEGYALNQQAKVAADVSTALFVVGAIAGGVGITVVLLAPSHRASVSLQAAPAGGALRVRF